MTMMITYKITLNVAVLLITGIMSFQSTSAMKCESKSMWGISTSISCPPLFGSDDLKYCCRSNEVVRCCKFDEFVLQSDSIWLIILVSLFVGAIVVICLCCLCCPFCLLYKRRHRGTVYGNVLQPGVETTATVQPSYPSQQPQMPTGVYPPQHAPYAVQAPMPQSAAPYPVQAPLHPMPQSASAALYPPPGYPAYPPHTVAAGQPPSYTEATAAELYVKQAPYNPNY